jgi:hypothetical protein
MPLSLPRGISGVATMPFFSLRSRISVQRILVLSFCALMFGQTPRPLRATVLFSTPTMTRSSSELASQTCEEVAPDVTTARPALSADSVLSAADRPPEETFSADIEIMDRPAKRFFHRRTGPPAADEPA